MLSKSVMNAIALIVTGVWTLSFLAQFVPALDYSPDPQINLIFGALLSGAFALPKLLGLKDKDEDEKPKAVTGGRHYRDGEE